MRRACAPTTSASARSTATRRARARCCRSPRARANGHKTDWRRYVPPAPATPGRHGAAATTARRARRLHRLGAVLPGLGAVRALPEDPGGRGGRRGRAQGASPRPRRCSRRSSRERWLTANGVFGLFPAAQVNGDDIEIYADEARRERLMTWHNLRQQNEKPTGRANLCLADFVAPQESGVRDYIGAFAVTAGGIEQRVADFEAKHDDYNAIMLKALADRLAEAFAERLHERVRREFWGYAADERLAERAADRREVPRHPPGARLSGVPGPHREGRAVRAARRRAQRRHAADRVLRDAADRRGVRLLPLAPGVELLRRRQDRARPGRGLRAARRHERRRGAKDGSRRISITSPKRQRRRYNSPPWEKATNARARARSTRAATARSARSA